MTRIFKNIPYRLEAEVLDANGKPKSGLSVSYTVTRCLNDELVYSGSLFETSSLYSAEITLTGTEQYRVRYTAPTTYRDGFENLFVEDYDNYKANVSSLALEATSQIITGSIANISSSLASVSSGSILNLSSSIVDVYDAILDVSSSNVVIYNAIVNLSSSLSGSNTQVYIAILDVSSSIVPLALQSTSQIISSSLASVSSGSIAQTYNAVSGMTGSITQMSSSLGIVEKFTNGKWKVEANQMTFYATDGVTVIGRFNLFDSIGAPAMTNVFERVPV